MTSEPKRHNVVCIFWVVAFAVLSAFNTSEQFPNTDEPLMFNDVVTNVGATTGFPSSTFTSPSTALYVVQYRLKIRGALSGTMCRVDLVVGSVIRKVSSNVHFYGKHEKSTQRVLAVRQKVLI